MSRAAPTLSPSPAHQAADGASPLPRPPLPGPGRQRTATLKPCILLGSTAPAAPRGGCERSSPSTARIGAVSQSRIPAARRAPGLLILILRAAPHPGWAQLSTRRGEVTRSFQNLRGAAHKEPSRHKVNELEQKVRRCYNSVSPSAKKTLLQLFPSANGRGNCQRKQ